MRKIYLTSMAIAAIISVALALWLLDRPPYVRGAWITGWGTGYNTPAEVDRTIAAAKEAGLNILWVEVRKAADAYYDSSFESWASEVKPGFDPLAYIIERAHREGIKVHACVSVYRIWRGSSHPTDSRHLANLRPEWLSYSAAGELNTNDGIFLNPGVPEVRDYINRLIGDIISNYDIDGIHLDFIRYPDAKWGYSEAALKRYYDDTGAVEQPKPDDPQWQAWRRTQVTKQVRTIRMLVNRIKPGLPITAATIAYGDCPAEFEDTAAYKNLGQNWRGWLNAGLIDANMPMNYKNNSDPEQAAQFEAWLDGFRRWGCGKPVFVGLASYMNDAEQIVEQIEAVRRHKLDGYVVFCLNESGIRVTQDRTHLIRCIRQSDSIWRRWDANCGEFLKW